jgi:hypothetical protein
LRRACRWSEPHPPLDLTTHGAGAVCAATKEPQKP